MHRRTRRLDYRRGVVQHGYQVIVGQSIVVVAGPLVVDQKVLRAAAAKVRPATPAELNVLGFPGEDCCHRRGPGLRGPRPRHPARVTLEPSDLAAAPQSMLIDVFVDSSQDPSAAPWRPARRTAMAWGTPHRGHARLRRAPRRPRRVRPMGGVGVDRALLRRAALDARPVTDEELLRSLPPVPSKGPLDRLAAGCAAEAAPPRTGGHEVSASYHMTGDRGLPDPAEDGHGDGGRCRPAARAGRSCRGTPSR